MPTEEQLLEIHRLAVLGQATAIAQDVGTRPTRRWLRVSRFREVRALSLRTLSLGPHAATTVHLARSQRILGEVQEALALYREALQTYEAVGDRVSLATTLNNMGLVYDSLGQREEALAYFQRALPTRKRWATGRGWRPPSITWAGVVNLIGHASAAFTPPHETAVSAICVGTGGRTHISHSTGVDPCDQAQPSD